MPLDSHYTLVLASQSPRRKELLGWVDIPFLICCADLDETSDFQDPLAICKDIAHQKGRAVLEQLKLSPHFMKEMHPLIVSADTIVTLNGIIFGKPADRGHAAEMLMALSGKTHRVITAVCLMGINPQGQLRQHTFACETDVTFAPISMDILSHYLDSGESLDKAGSYGIQGKGLTFVSDVRGSYSNVVGFPLNEFIDQLKTFLDMAHDDAGAWRQYFKRDLSFWNGRS